VGPIAARGEARGDAPTDRHVVELSVGAAPPPRREIVFRAAGQLPSPVGTDGHVQTGALGHEVVNARIHLAEVFDPRIDVRAAPPRVPAGDEGALLRTELVERVERRARDRQGRALGESPAAVRSQLETPRRVSQRERSAVEPGQAEPRGYRLTAELENEALARILRVAFQQLHGGVGAGPCVGVAHRRSEPSRRAKRQSGDAESPERQVGGGGERRAAEHGAGAEEGAVGES
jgi:hypothetical protein